MKVVSWDGNNINDTTNYIAWIEPFSGLPGVAPVLPERDGRWPVLGGVRRPGRTINLFIFIKAAGADAARTNLHKWFDPEDETSKQLVIEDNDGSNDRYVNAICTALQPDPVSQSFKYVATLQVDGDVRWRKTTADTDTWNITASGQTNTLTNGGEDDAYPIFKITPTSAKTGGYSKKRWVMCRWRATEEATRYPVDICNDSFDTAAEISGGDMQADGDDLRVFVDGVEVDRWLQDINTTTTQVWVNLSFLPKQETTIDGALGTGDTTINVDDDISEFPSEGILYIDSEAITYTGRSTSLKRFTGCTRGAKGTTAATHTDGTTIFWVQHDIWILYGNSAVTAPTTNDDFKPPFELNSTNTSWDYNNFGGDNGETHSVNYSKWIHVILASKLGNFYTANQFTNATPWSEMGIDLSRALSFEGGVFPGDLIAHWRLFNVCGITNANFQNGEKWANSGAFYWEAYVRSTKTRGGGWTEEYTITAPTVANTWQSWSQNVALTTGSNGVGLYLRQKANKIDGERYRLEVSDVTLTLNSSKTPSITLGSEQGNYSLTPTITNNTTGESISINATVEINERLDVDTDKKTVIYQLDNNNLFNTLTIDGGPRRDWLKLQPGANEIQFDDTGTNAVTVVTEWEERHYT